MLALNVKLTFIANANLFTKDFTATSESQGIVLINCAFQSVK